MDPSGRGWVADKVLAAQVVGLDWMIRIESAVLGEYRVGNIGYRVDMASY